MKSLLLAAIVTLSGWGCGGDALRVPPSSTGQAGSGGSGGDAGSTGFAGDIGVAGVVGTGGVMGAEDPLPARLSAQEIARRLSLYLWETDPDAALLQAVASAPPTKRSDVGRLATTMLADPRARVGVAAFYRLWLSLETLGTAKKDPALYPEFTTALRDDMIAEAEQLTVFITLNGDGRFPTLFTADFGFLNARLAPLYGVGGVVGTDLVKTPLDRAQRSGVLTLAGVLANVPQTTQPPVSHRGAFVSSLLCRQIPPGPPTLQMDQAPGANQSTRDWIASLTTNAPACAACHSQMDPPGLAFTSYDTLGRYSTTERGFAVDPSGTWTVNGDQLTFTGPRDLSTQLAALELTQECFVEKWLKFATGNDLDVSDPSLRQALFAFKAANLDIRALIVAVATTDAFLAL